MLNYDLTAGFSMSHGAFVVEDGVISKLLRRRN